MLTVDIKRGFRNNGRLTFLLDVAFTARQGVTVLFGPSGSGKTTVLRCLAGMMVPDEGKIVLGERAYFDSSAQLNMPIHERRVGFVFQDYLLFPHLTAEGNVLYGMRVGKDPGKRNRARDLLGLMGIESARDRYPRELSGGEQQRVALARAMASEPAIMLLDEPLSAIDLSTRSRLLQEIIDLQKRSGIPFIYVTHSPADAVRAGDWALFLDQGRVLQEGRPSEVFNSPQNVPLARAVGTENIFVGTILSHSPSDGITVLDLQGCQLIAKYNGLTVGTKATVGISSEDIIVCREPIGQTSARNLLPGIVRTIIRDGDKMGLVASCGVDFKVSVTGQAIDALGLRPGVVVYLLIKASACHTLS
jgi:molybdate transport system ATP-binding protein